MAQVTVCRADEVPAGEIVCKRVTGAGQIAVARLADNGELVAFESRCPHAQGPLAEGKLHGSVVVCPWHFFHFDLRTGKTPGANSILTVRRFPVTVKDGAVLVEVE